MRVSIVTETFTPQVNGIVRMLQEFLGFLRERGHEAIVFAPGDGEHQAWGYEVVRIAGAPCPLYPDLTLAPYSVKLARVMRAWRPDVVHLAGPFVLGVHGLKVARSLRVPVAAHYQTDLARYAEHYGLGALASVARPRLIDIHNACDVTFAPTLSVARDLRAQGMCRVQVGGRGVDSSGFHPLRRDVLLRERLGADDEHPLLLYVGRLSPEKNLAALAAVARVCPHCPFLIVGDGPARGMLAAQLADCPNAHLAGTLAGAPLRTR